MREAHERGDLAAALARARALGELPIELSLVRFNPKARTSHRLVAACAGPSSLRSRAWRAQERLLGGRSQGLNTSFQLS